MQNGALKLKKHNFSKKVALSICALALAAAITAGFFTGCKTLPVEKPVNALDLLDDESAFYIAIPNEVDPELVVRFLQNNIQNLSEKDAQLISSRIDNVYCGLNHKKNKTIIQIASDARIGDAVASKIFTAKNGWESNLVITTFKKTYNVYDRDNLELAFPSSDIALIGRDIPVMLNHLDNIRSLEGDLEALPPHLLDDQVYEYLNGAGAEKEIRFYAGRPQSFLTTLTGAQLDLKLDHVSGSFVCDPKYEGQYILKLDFKFKNETYMKAGRGLLTLAFGLTNSNCQLIGEDELIISDIKIAKKSLYKILIL